MSPFHPQIQRRKERKHSLSAGGKAFEGINTVITPPALELLSNSKMQGVKESGIFLKIRKLHIKSPCKCI